MERIGVLGGMYIGGELYVMSDCGNTVPVSRLSRILRGSGVKRRSVSSNTARTGGLRVGSVRKVSRIFRALGLTVFQRTYVLDRRRTLWTEHPEYFLSSLLQDLG